MNGLNDVNRYYNGNIEELRGRKDPEAVKIVAKEMERLFAYEMIKAMRETTDTSSKNNLGGSTYMSMFDMELAKLFSERGLGLQDMLLKGLNRIAGKQSAGEEKDTAVSPGQTSVNGQKPAAAIQNIDSGKPVSPAVSGNVHPPSAVSSTAESGVADTKGSSSEAIRTKDQTQNEDTPLSLPVDGTISSRFGMRKHPLHGDKRFHYGIDIAAPEGTDVYPLKKGTVIFSGEKSGYGNMVIIQHEDGFISKYAHNEVNFVKEGDSVDSETIIAKVGSTGKSTGPHLHFEVSYKGQRVNPLKVVSV